MISYSDYSMASVFVLLLAAFLLGRFIKAPTNNKKAPKNNKKAPTNNVSLERQRALKLKVLQLSMEKSIASVKKAISSQAAYSNSRVGRKEAVRQGTSFGLSVISFVDGCMESFSMPPLAAATLKVLKMGQQKDEGRARERALKWNELEESVGKLQRDVIGRSYSELQSMEARLDKIRKAANETAHSDGVDLQF